jgi:hypothetical protein
MALQNKIVDLIVTGFPLWYCKDLPVRSKRTLFLSVFAEGLGLLTGESVKIRHAQDYRDLMLQSRVRIAPKMPILASVFCCPVSPLIVTITEGGGFVNLHLKHMGLRNDGSVFRGRDILSYLQDLG